MEDVQPTPVVGTLPSQEKSSSDRVGRVTADDLELATPYDIAGGGNLVTSVVSKWVGGPDLVLEATSAGLVTPVRLSFPRPFARNANRFEIEVYLVPGDMTELRRFVDSTQFLFDGESVRAFLHAIVVAHPSCPPPHPVTDERSWAMSKLQAAGLAPGVPVPVPPDGVLLWTVGLETDRWTYCLQSGLTARPVRGTKAVSPQGEVTL